MMKVWIVGGQSGAGTLTTTALTYMAIDIEYWLCVTEKL